VVSTEGPTVTGQEADRGRRVITGSAGNAGTAGPAGSSSRGAVAGLGSVGVGDAELGRELELVLRVRAAEELDAVVGIVVLERVARGPLISTTVLDVPSDPLLLFDVLTRAAEEAEANPIAICRSGSPGDSVGLADRDLFAKPRLGEVVPGGGLGAVVRKWESRGVFGTLGGRNSDKGGGGGNEEGTHVDNNVYDC